MHRFTCGQAQERQLKHHGWQGERGRRLEEARLPVRVFPKPAISSATERRSVLQGGRLLGRGLDSGGARLAAVLRQGFSRDAVTLELGIWRYRSTWQ